MNFEDIISNELGEDYINNYIDYNVNTMKDYTIITIITSWDNINSTESIYTYDKEFLNSIPDKLMVFFTDKELSNLKKTINDYIKSTPYNTILKKESKLKPKIHSIEKFIKSINFEYSKKIKFKYPCLYKILLSEFI